MWGPQTNTRAALDNAQFARINLINMSNLRHRDPRNHLQQNLVMLLSVLPLRPRLKSEPNADACKNTRRCTRTHASHLHICNTEPFAPHCTSHRSYIHQATFGDLFLTGSWCHVAEPPDVPLWNSNSFFFFFQILLTQLWLHFSWSALYNILWTGTASRRALHTSCSMWTRHRPSVSWWYLHLERALDCIVDFVTFGVVSRFLILSTQKIRPLQLSKALALEDQCDQQAQYWSFCRAA